MSDAPTSDRRTPARDPLLSSRRIGFFAAVLVIAVLLLIFADSYWRTNLIVCSIKVMLVIGLDFVVGYAGQLNLGQSALYGLGAYVSTLLITRLGVPFWAAFAGAILFSGAAGMLLSIFAARLRGHYLAIASLGLNTQAWKVFAFGVGSAVAGAAGCFYASFVGTLVPDAFFITESFTILAMVIVGGMGTLIGPVCGAILLTVLPEPLRGLGDLRLIVYGLALTLVVLFMPGGIAQAVQLAAARLRRLGLRGMPAEHPR